ncbi:MAG: helix-turn-helix domain-containing protein [Caulobacteraceae bacterium]|nr:helix-turn-helix domain-containing protein [Caulobacteraceae bacterium]
MAALAQTNVVRQPWGMTYESVDQQEQALLGKALAMLREEAGLTQPQAAERFGIKTSAGWSKYERGLAPKILTLGTQMKLATAIGRTAEDLTRTRNMLAMANPEGVPVKGEVVAFDRRSYPAEAMAAPGMCNVYGLAAGQGEYIAIASGHELRQVPMHPAQRNYPQIGAVEVVGESMFPRWKPRELAYFVFNLPPAREDDVIVELQDGTAIIKEYLGRTKTHLMLREYFPEQRDFDLSLKDVKAIHAVVG